MRKIIAILAALGIAAGAGLFVTGTASADPVIGSCPAGKSTINYTPGLTNEAADVHEAGDEQSGLCTFLSPAGLSKSFTTSFAGTRDQAACTNVLGKNATGTQTFVWDDGTTSEWDYTTISVQNVNGSTITTLRGQITADSATFAGVSVNQVVAFPNTQLSACTQPGGLTQQSGPSTYTFAKLS